MEKICLNFLNEKLNKNLISSLNSLKKEISKQCFFSDYKKKLFIIKYIKD